MKKCSYVLSVLTVFLSGCAAQSKVPDVVILLNDHAAKAISRYSEAVSKKRVPVEFDSGEKADTCESYTRLSAKSTLKEDVANQLGKSEYLMCDVLAIVGNRKTLAGDIHKTTSYGKALASRLDLRTFPSSFFQMLDEKKNTLTQLNSKVVTTSTSAISETDEWRYRLELVAVLDVDKNGKPDWVVWLSDESKSGNYRGYQTLIAYDVAESVVIGAKPYRQK